MIVLVGLTVTAFARRSLHGDPRAPRFFALAPLLCASTVLMAIGSTALIAALGWLATGLVLTAMIGHNGGWAPADHAVRRTRATFALGDTALAAALVIVMATIGDVDMRAMSQAAVDLGTHRLGLGPFEIGADGAVALLLVVAGTSRSALLPFHRWLPTTLAAPTPVSAMLHAGVINGAGVLLIRFAPVFVTSRLAVLVAFALGVATAVWATATMAVRADVKGSLVWSTSGQMGFMVIQIAVGAFAAALFHIVGHAMYKAALFLGAGGSIVSAADHRFLPHGDRPIGTGARLAIAAAVPAAALAAGLAVFDPHLTASSTVMVAVFGWASAATALNSWLRTAPWSATTSVATGIAVSALSVLGYVGGLTLFESFVADTVPYDAPNVVGVGLLVPTLALVALLGAAVRFAPGQGPIAGAAGSTSTCSLRARPAWPGITPTPDRCCHACPEPFDAAPTAAYGIAIAKEGTTP